MNDPAQYVTAVNPNDVLFGRGSGPNDHEGNIRFRDMVSQRKAEYTATNHRQTKAEIARTIVDSVFASNGRFLKKLEPAELQKLGFASAMDVYQVADNDTIMEKAKQALRQNRDKNSSGSNPTVESNAQQVPSSLAPKAPSRVGQDSLSRQVVQTSQEQFGMPNATTSAMLNPIPAFSIDEQEHRIQEDADGYATYTTTLEDPEDDRLFDNTSRRVQGGPDVPTGPRRGSLLGGRKIVEGRRDSLQLTDVWRRESLLGRGESMQMSELMESFRGMSTTGELNSSSDTIGTIDANMNSQMSGISNMSVISMASANFISSNENAIGTNSGSGDSFAGTSWNNSNSQGVQQRQMNPRGSMIPRDAWSSSQLHYLLQAPIEGSSTMLALDASGGAPRPVQLMEEQPDSLAYLGSSSMSILRAADQSSSSNSFRPETNSSSNLGQDSDRISTPGRK